MDSPKDRANDSNRKPVKKEEVDSKKPTEKPFSFADDPSSRNTGWFFSGK
jgi:hypothetical protein